MNDPNPIGHRRSPPFLLNESWVLLDDRAPPIYCCDFNLGAYDDAWYRILGICLPARIAAAVPKRRAEYLAGRYVANIALSTLGLAGVDIPSAADRSPRWPPVTVGSISHTDRQAMACVAEAKALHGLGIDAERFISHSMIEEIAPTVVTAAETKRLAALDMPYEHAFTLVFSAKESLFKAIYPSVGRFFDCMAAQLIDVDTRAQRFMLVLLEDLSERWHRGNLVYGHYRFSDLGVLSQVAIAARA